MKHIHHVENISIVLFFEVVKIHYLKISPVFTPPCTAWDFYEVVQSRASELLTWIGRRTMFLRCFCWTVCSILVNLLTTLSQLTTTVVLQHFCINLWSFCSRRISLIGWLIEFWSWSLKCDLYFVQFVIFVDKIVYNDWTHIMPLSIVVHEHFLL